MRLDGLGQQFILGLGPKNPYLLPPKLRYASASGSPFRATGKLAGDALPVLNTTLVDYSVSDGRLHPPWNWQQIHVKQGPLSV